MLLVPASTDLGTSNFSFITPKYLSKSGNLKPSRAFFTSSPSFASFCIDCCATSAFLDTFSSPVPLILLISEEAVVAELDIDFNVVASFVPSLSPSCLFKLLSEVTRPSIDFLASVALDLICIFNESMFIIFILIKKDSEFNHCPFFCFANSKLACLTLSPAIRKSNLRCFSSSDISTSFSCILCNAGLLISSK